MKRWVIVGAGGFGREVYAWITARHTDNRKEAIVFIDDNLRALDSYEYDVPIISTIRGFLPSPGDRLVMAIGSPKVKLDVAEQLLSKGAQFATVVHPTAVIGPNTKMGVGCIICPYAVITSDVTLGDFVMVNASATIGHDAVIGSGCTLSGHVDITGHAKLGKGVYVGSHASVLPNVEIGDYCMVGAGSVVVRSVKDRTTVFGNPAKRIVVNR